jgi:hypothetical protein
VSGTQLVTNNAWYSLKINYTNQGNQIYIDSTSYLSSAATSANPVLGIYIGNDRLPQFLVDWVRVRKSASSEPTTAIGAETSVGLPWDNTNDANLNLLSTSQTTITGLNSGTSYSAKIYAFDNFGNIATVIPASSITTGGFRVVGSTATSIGLGRDNRKLYYRKPNSNRAHPGQCYCSLKYKRRLKDSSYNFKFLN